MRIFIGLWILLLTLPVISQVRMTDLLSFPVSEDEMSMVIAREEYLSTHKFNSPWLRELDFRLRPNNTETSLSDYRLRFGILNPMEIKANRDYYKLLVRQQSFKRKQTINNVLKRRYELILEGYYLMRSLEIGNENLKRLQQIRTILLEEASEVGKLIALDEKVTKQELAIFGIRRGINQLMPAYLALGLDSLSMFSDDEWISKEQILALITRTDDGQTLRLQAEQQKLEREANILQINKAEAFSNLGFIQAEYDAERGDSRDEQVRFQLGIQIPIFNTDRPDNQRRELALLEDQAGYQTLVQQGKEERKAHAVELVDYLREWNLLEGKERRLEEYRQTIEEVGGTAEDYERLQSYLYYLQDKKLRVRLDVYYKYINQLAESGDLVTQPYQNYLLSSLASFELEGG